MGEAADAPLGLEVYIERLMCEREGDRKPAFSEGQVVRIFPDRPGTLNIASGTTIGVIERVPTFHPFHAWARRSQYGVRVHFGDGSPAQLLGFYEPELALA